MFCLITQKIFKKIQRDDLVNPYWIEERELGSGKQQFLSGHETQFWKDLISKYLEPLIKNKEKEKKQADELLQLRTGNRICMMP